MLCIFSYVPDCTTNVSDSIKQSKSDGIYELIIIVFFNATPQITIRIRPRKQKRQERGDLGNSRSSKFKVIGEEWKGGRGEEAELGGAGRMRRVGQKRERERGKQINF